MYINICNQPLNQRAVTHVDCVGKTTHLTEGHVGLKVFVI